MGFERKNTSISKLILKNDGDIDLKKNEKKKGNK